MTGNEPRISCIGSNCSTNCATTTEILGRFGGRTFLCLSYVSTDLERIRSLLKMIVTNVEGFCPLL